MLRLEKFLSLRFSQRSLFAALSSLFLIALLLLLRKFSMENSVLVPGSGGTYIEGSIGDLQPLIPWFSVQNDVNRDILSLACPGLLKYDPVTEKIRDDVATLVVSNEGRIYTVKLKEGIQWHDSTETNPHPVTADDILFTFQSIQKPEFPNPILQQNFLGVDIQKIDDRTVQFRLDEPYSFFSSNLTLGIVPKRSFADVPVSKLDQVLDFGFHPVCAGPYMFKSLVQTELSTEITLERFERPMEPDYRLERIVFRIFPDYSTLLADIRNIDGVRLVPMNSSGDRMVPRQFRTVHYSLPQYVALYFNLDRKILSDTNLRIGLQLGTNKQEIVDGINESLIVDTPLLELDLSDWRYKFDANAAQGALFSSNWNLPEKVRLQRLLEIREANSVGPLKISPIVLLDTGAILTVTGSLEVAPIGSSLNGIPVTLHPSETGAWISPLPTKAGTGSLILGMNLVKLTSPKGTVIDSFYVWRTGDAKEFKLASAEQDSVDRFVLSRDQKIPDADRIGVSDLYVENGMLRKRLQTDPLDFRVNDLGEKLSLTLLTSPTPPQYRVIAGRIADQWAALGVKVAITIPPTRKDFEEKLLARDYDLLLYGQSLLDNLDAYPYWHSSGVQKVSESKFDLRIDAYNLSQYSSIAADGLLEVIRTTGDDAERQDALTELMDVLKSDVPAIFLYSPLYAFAYHEDLKGVELGSPSLHSDRFNTLSNWYLKEERLLRPGVHWSSFPRWLFTLL